MLTRIMCVGPSRAYEAAVTLSFDDRIDAHIDQTIIVSSYHESQLKHLWNTFEIDYQHIKFMYDTDVQLLIWTDHHWYRQQGIKLELLSTIDSDSFLIQDCDVFMLKAYSPFNQGPVFRVEDLWNNYQTVYADAVEQLIGEVRTVPFSFVTEIMPYYKQDWLDCAALIQRRHGPWQQSIPAWRKFDESKWFSEYELLGIYKTHVSCEYGMERDVHPRLDTWEDVWETDWHRVPSVKFKSRPLKFMTKSQAQNLVQYFRALIV